MKKYLPIFLVVMNLFSCSQSKVNNDIEIVSNESIVSIQKDNLINTFKDSFSSIDEILEPNNYSSWININKKDSSTSLRLVFNINDLRNDTLSMEYSPECWLEFPYRKSSDNIEVLFDHIIDSKYNFNIVKKMDKADKKFHGKPFVILELVNDTTLSAKYPFPDLIDFLNSAESDRNLFPTSFILQKYEGE